MKLCTKKPSPEPAGRRRPLSSADRPSAGPATAFSYHAQRSYNDGNTGRLDNEQAVVRDRPRPASYAERHHGLLVVLTIGLVLGGLYSLFSGTDPKMILLQDKATAYFLQDPDVYRRSVQDTLSASIFNRNKLTVDTSSVRQNLLSNYPEIKHVSGVLPIIGGQQQVFIEPYKPSFILTTTDHNAFLLDATGRALASTSQISDIDSLHVPIMQDQSGISVKLGSRALPSRTVSFTQTVVAALAAKGVTASSLVLPRTVYELDVYIAGKPYFVKFNLQGDPLQGAGTYLATKQRLEKDKQPVAAYIDVRVAGRAYYR